MADFNKPDVDSLYVDWETEMQSHFASQAKLYDDGVSWTNLPTNTIRWNSSNSRFEKWNGSSWANLSTALTDVCKTANNLSDLASASTARTNLGLGTIAVENTPLALNKGGSGATDAATARTNFGLGTIATQAASAVAITGGTLSGITALTFASASTIDFTSGGTISKCAVLQNSGDVNIKTLTADYWIYFVTNNVQRWYVNSSGLIPYANNSYDLGTSSLGVRDAYIAGRLFTTVINAAADINVNISNTTYWVFGATSKDFRPNTDSTQNLGHASYKWSSAYINTIIGTQTSIHLSDSGDVHIRYLANNTGDHKFYQNAGAEEVFRIESTGKLYPVKIGRFDYAINWTGWTTLRTMPPSGTGAPTLTDVSNLLATLIADLVSLGLLQ